MHSVDLIIASVGILVFLAHLFAAIFNRTKIPDVLFLILIGLIFGPVLGMVTPGNFGSIGPIFTVITLIIILFEGGLDLHIDVLRKAWRRTLTLAVLSFSATMVVVGFAALWLTDLGPALSFMLGAIVGSVSPAVILPLVRQLNMQKEAGTTLSLESAVSDVLSIVVVLAFLEAQRLGEIRVGLLAGHLISSFILAIIFGALGAFIWSVVLNRLRLIQNSIFTTPAFVFIIFGLVELLGYSGYIAALVFGITLGNIELFNLSLIEPYIPDEPIALTETEKAFFSEIVFLLKTFFFVYIGLSIQLTEPWSIVLGLMLTVLILVVRAPVVRFSIPKTTAISDASLMAVMAPKGLAAAVLATIPLQQGIVGGALIQNVTYAVILFSIILTSLLIFLLGKTRLSALYGWIFSKFSTSLEPMVEDHE